MGSESSLKHEIILHREYFCFRWSTSFQSPSIIPDVNQSSRKDTCLLSPRQGVCSLLESLSFNRDWGSGKADTWLGLLKLWFGRELLEGRQGLLEWLGRSQFRSQIQIKSIHDGYQEKTQTMIRGTADAGFGLIF